MKSIKLYLTAILWFTVSTALANDIYIEQVGDTLDLDIVQDGANNVIGTATTAAILEGDGMTFDITQTGSANVIAATIKGVNYEGTWDFTGDRNTVDMLCSSVSSGNCDDVTLNVTVDGDDNEFKFYVGQSADAEDLLAAFTVDGDGNVFDVDVDGTDANITVTVDNSASLASNQVTSATDNNLSTSVAGGNIIDLDIDGNGDTNGHEIILDITGGGSSYTINQSGVNDNKVDATFSGDGQTVNITQSD